MYLLYVLAIPYSVLSIDLNFLTCAIAASRGCAGVAVVVVVVVVYGSRSPTGPVPVYV